MEPFEGYSVQGSCSEKVSGGAVVDPNDITKIKPEEYQAVTYDSFNEISDQETSSDSCIAQFYDKAAGGRSAVNIHGDSSQAFKKEVDFSQFNSFLQAAGDITFSEDETIKGNTRENKSVGPQPSAGSAPDYQDQGSTLSSLHFFSGASQTSGYLCPEMLNDVSDALYATNSSQIDEPSENPTFNNTTKTSAYLSKIPPYFGCDSCRKQYDPVCPRHNCHSCRQRVGPFSALLCQCCDNAFHVACMTPPLLNLYQDRWFCHGCWPNRPIAPGRSLLFTGKVPGILVGASWKYRFQLNTVNLHKPIMAGIHGSGDSPAYSIVLQGGYALDEDNGFDFFYTGAGGRDAKDTHIMDQELTKTNLALACSCDADIDYEGATARDWTKSSPVRVIRGARLKLHRPQYAPENFRYDGIYKLVRYWKERIPEGFIVWRFHFRRDDTEPAPWTPEGKQYILDNNILFEDHDPIRRAPRALAPPDALPGHSPKTLLVTLSLHSPVKARCIKKSKSREAPLPFHVFERVGVDLLKSDEAEMEVADDAEMQMDYHGEMQVAEDNEIQATKDVEAQVAYVKVQMAEDNEIQVADEVPEIIYISDTEESPESTAPCIPTPEVLFRAAIPFILQDSRNQKLWNEILVDKAQSYKQFFAKVREAFECNVCYDLVEYTLPCTTVCGHNFCRACFRAAVHLNMDLCPTCKNHLPDDCMEEGLAISAQSITNVALGEALRALNPAFKSDH